MLSQLLDNVVSIAPKSLIHRFANAFDETVAARIAFGDQVLDDSAYVVEAIANIGSVLTRELNNVNCVPDYVILADSLKPESLNAQRATSNF